MSILPPELGHRILRAGAGAGKTTTLVATFIAFVKAFRESHQGEFPRVVVTTFTRKATQEVRERLMKKALESGEDEIFHYLGEKSRVHLSTIHGLLSLYLSRYGEGLGLPPDFRFVSQAELDWISRRELRRLLADSENHESLVEAYSFSELWRLLEAWRENVKPHGKAAPVGPEWMRQKTLAGLRELCDEARILANAIPGQTKNARLLEWGEVLGSVGSCPETDEELEKFLDRLAVMDELFGTKPSAPLSDEAMNERKKEFKNLWDRFADPSSQEMHRPSFWRRHEERSRLFEELAESWLSRVEKTRIEQGLLSMADLEAMSLRLIRENPASAEAFSREWDYWMIDEYQDTSPVQVELLRHLVGDRPCFVVGDPQQSIYFFRGARSQVFFEKMEELEKRKALVQSVAVNHRSRTPLLEFFNAFYGSHPDFSAMESKPKRTAFPADHPAAVFRIVEREEGRDVCIEAAIERIQELLRDPEIKPESICVLSRTNDPLKRLQTLARTLGLPVQLHTAGGFASRREIKDVLAFLRFLLNPSDNLNFLILLRGPWLHVSDERIVSYCKSGDVSYWGEALRQEEKESKEHPVLRLKDYLRQSSFLGLAETLKLFYRQEGILDASKYFDPTGRHEANLWKILVQLETAQRNPGFNALAFVDSLNQRVLSTEEGNDDGDAVPAIEPKRVQLMTVHASKGLEFDHVIILGLEKAQKGDRASLLMIEEETGLWTLGERDLSGSLRSSALAQQILERRNQLLSQESLRVLYVAMTRAMQTLSLIWEKPRTKTGRPLSGSWANAVPFDLSEGEHDTGNFRYVVRTEPPRVHPEAGDSSSAGELHERWPQRTSAVWNQSVSPTELLEGGTSAESRASRGAFRATEGLKVAQRGTEAHRLFEALKYSSPEEVEALIPEQGMKDGLQWMLRSEELPLLEIIRSGFVEWGFTTRQGSFILQGQIDLWGEASDQVFIVDYKTGSPSQAPKALDQMIIYAWALRNMGQIRDDQGIRLVALYPLDKTLREKRFARLGDLAAEWSRLLPLNLNLSGGKNG